MRYMRYASFGLAAAGVLVVLAALVFDLGGAVQLTGILLAWAGVVKIVVVHLWTHVAGLGTDRHDPVPPV
jgi:hypothetical protein